MKERRLFLIAALIGIIILASCGGRGRGDEPAVDVRTAYMLSSDQQYFAIPRGYPPIFFVTFHDKVQAPDGSISTLSTPARTEKWIYVDPYNDSIDFSNGHFVGLKTLPETRGFSQTVRSDLCLTPDQLFAGMSTDQAITVFGEPEYAAETSDSANHPIVVYRWRGLNADRILTLTFLDGKLIGAVGGFYFQQ